MSTICPAFLDLKASLNATLVVLVLVVEISSLIMPKQSRRKKSLSFSGFFRATNLLFHRLSQQKVNVIMTFINGHDDHVYSVNSCFTQIFVP